MPSQFGKIERLLNDSVDAKIGFGVFRESVSMSGHDEGGRRISTFTNSFQKCGTIHVRHGQVGNNYVNGCGFQSLERLFAMIHNVNGNGWVGFEIIAVHFPHYVIIFDKKNMDSHDF